MSLDPAWHLRPLVPLDLHGLLQVQARCYDSDFLESAAVYGQRLASDDPQSMGAFCARTQALQAYAAAYWSDAGRVTPFDGDFHPSASPQPVLYLHDVSVSPDWSGRGAARALLSALFQRARERGVRQAALVSVQGSQSYWARHGFAVKPVSDVTQQARLRSYGDDAAYMMAPL